MSEQPLPPRVAARRLVGESSTVVLVEGVSDQRAVEALAARNGRDLLREGVAIVAMGGATNIAHFLDLFGPAGADLTLAGLCDAGQEHVFRRGLQRSGLGLALDITDLARLGFFVCDADLEDELIRALGVTAVEQVIADQGELASLRLLQSQPAQRVRTHHQQLRRFLGTRAGRKIRYAQYLIEALDPGRAPPPLERLLAATGPVRRVSYAASGAGRVQRLGSLPLRR